MIAAMIAAMIAEIAEMMMAAAGARLNRGLQREVAAAGVIGRQQRRMIAVMTDVMTAVMTVGMIVVMIAVTTAATTAAMMTKEEVGASRATETVLAEIGTAH